MTGPAERARLAELARAATGGPWRLARAATGGPWRQVSVSDNNDRWTVTPASDIRASLFVAGRVRSEADAAYIAAADPDVILALLARLAALEAVASAARAVAVHTWYTYRDLDNPSRDIASPVHPNLAAALRALDGTE